jgi:hypothetical protein
MFIQEKRKLISDFIRTADERALDRMIDIVESCQTNIIGYTLTGEPITIGEALSFLSRERGVLSQEEMEKRTAVLNRLKNTEVHSAV